jgi:hypothetical protein
LVQTPVAHRPDERATNVARPEILRRSIPIDNECIINRAADQGKRRMRGRRTGVFLE